MTVGLIQCCIWAEPKFGMGSGLCWEFSFTFFFFSCLRQRCAENRISLYRKSFYVKNQTANSTFCFSRSALPDRYQSFCGEQMQGNVYLGYRSIFSQKDILKENFWLDLLTYPPSETFMQWKPCKPSVAHRSAMQSCVWWTSTSPHVALVPWCQACQFYAGLAAKCDPYCDISTWK